MTFSNPIVGGTTLIRPAIQSPNFIAGASGWSINKDGSAEFNNVTVRGTGTTDAVVVGPANGPQVKIGSLPTLGFIQLPTHRPAEQGIATLLGAVNNQGAANEYLSFQLQGPTVSGFTDRAQIYLDSQNEDGSSNANIQLLVTGGNVTFDKTRLSTSVVASTNSAFLVQAAAGHNGPVIRGQVGGVDQFIVGQTGNTSVTGILTAGNRITGNVTITPVANTPTSAVVTFPTALKGSTFTCQVSANTSVPGTQVTGVSFNNLSATGVTIWLTRTNTNSTTVSYTVEGF